MAHLVRVGSLRDNLVISQRSGMRILLAVISVKLPCLLEMRRIRYAIGPSICYAANWGDEPLRTVARMRQRRGWPDRPAGRLGAEGTRWLIVQLHPKEASFDGSRPGRQDSALPDDIALQESGTAGPANCWSSLHGLQREIEQDAQDQRIVSVAPSARLDDILDVRCDVQNIVDVERVRSRQNRFGRLALQ